MSYQEYVDKLLVSFELDYDRAKYFLDRVYTEYKEFVFRRNNVSLEELKNINNQYKLNIDLSDEENYKLVIPAFRRLIEVLMVELQQSETFRESIKSDFRKKVPNLPLFLLSLISGDFLGYEKYIESIFLKLLEASSKDLNIEEYKIQTYEGDNFDKLQGYQQELYSAYENKDMDVFKSIALEYFNYFLEHYTVKEMMKAHDIDFEEARAKYQSLINRIELNVRANRINLPKKISNIFRKGVDSLVGFLDKEIENVTKVLNEVKYFMFQDDSIMKFMKKDLQTYFDFYNCDSLEELVAKLISIKVFSQSDKERAYLTLNSYSNKGMIDTTYNLPAFAVSFVETELDMFFQYLLVTGIKINGISEKKGYGYNEEELHKLEQEMAQLINFDFVVDSINIDKFIDLYRKYIKSYLDYFGDRLSDKFNSDELIDKAVNRMRKYLDNARNFVGANGVSDKKAEKVNVQPLVQQEFVEVKKSFQEEFLGSDFALYEKAKRSYNAEALQVVEDIDALIELLQDATTEESEKLKSTCKEYIEILRKLMTPKKKKRQNDLLNIPQEEKKDVTPEIVYFKDGDAVPYLFRSIEKNQKGDYKDIYSTLSKIIDGNIIGDRELKGINLPIKIYFKGKNFKVFYVVFDNVIIFVDGGTTDKKYGEVINLVNSRAFLEFLEMLQVLLRSKSVVDESEYTKMIMKELEKSSAVRKQLIFKD